ATAISANITISAGATTGPRAVSVTNAGPGGGTATLAGGFTVLAANPAPTLTGAAPVRARAGSSLDVTLTGSGFVSGVTSVTFGAGITVSSTNVTSATSLTAAIAIDAGAAAGARDIEVI